MKGKWLVFLLNIFDPGRHERGLVTFERPGSIRFNTEKYAEVRRNKEIERKLLEQK